MHTTHQCGRLRSLGIVGFGATLLFAILLPSANAQTQPASPKTTSVISPSGIFVAVGYGGRRKSSEDGIHWQNDTEWAEEGGDDDNCLFSVVFAQGKFVAVGGGASKGHVVVTRDGKSWKEVHTTTTRIVPIVYGNKRFIVGTEGGFQFSSDGENWKKGSPLTYDRGLYFRRAAYGNGVFVFAGDCDIAGGMPRGGWFATTKDGEKVLSFVTSNLPNNRAIAFGAGKFVMIGEKGYRATSTDGIAWKVSSDKTEDFRHVFWDGKRFILSADGKVFLSSDGLAWTKTAQQWLSCEPQCLSPKGMVGVSWKTNLWHSENALDWKKVSEDGTNAFCSVAYGVPTAK